MRGRPVRPQQFPVLACSVLVMLALTAPACGSRSDAAVAADARAHLSADPALEGASVEVIAKKGIVLLRGRTATLDQPRAAVAILEQVSGVRRVVSQLTLTDEGIRQAAEQSFSRDALLAGVPIAVTVSGGVVQLESTATGAEQRSRAVAIARALPGVVHVEDDMK
jgi:osmotically-inducible protein OsmY